MQRCEHARAPGSRTLDMATQALSNRSREQGRGHARTYAVPLHARASMQGGEHSAIPRQATGSQIHASSKESRPPAKSAPWPAPRQATGSQIHASSKESRPPAKSAPWPAPRQATGSQIHASSKESRPPAKSAPWPAPRQATGSQIHASSKESRKTAGSQPEVCNTKYITGPPREVSTSRILKASKPLRSTLPQVQPIKTSLKSFLMKMPTSNTISSKICAQKKHRLATSPCNLKSSLPVTKIFQQKLQQAAHLHHKIKHSTHHLYSNKELVTSTLYSSTSDDNHLQHSTSSPIMETSQSPSERCPNSCSAKDVDYRYSPDSEKISHSSMDDDTLDNSPTQYSYANSEASNCSLDSSVDLESNPDSTLLSAESDILVEKQILPFSNLSRRWYKNEQRFYNILRDSRRRSNPVERDSDNVIISMNRSEVQGSLETNLALLHEKILAAQSNSTTSHYRALCEVADFILQNGPLVNTQDTGKVYLDSKGLQTKKSSCEYYEIFSKHLNLVQVYIHQRAFLIANISSNVKTLINTIESSVNTESILRDQFSKRVGNLIQSSLPYMDTHRDRQVVKALLAELTSVNFATKLQGLHSRQGTTTAKKALSSHLVKFSNITQTSQIVRSDLTNTQQYRMTQRIISSRKIKEIQTIAKGRGRKLKSEMFPELSVALEYAFGECDLQHGGGGLEAHPRLITGTLYKAADNVTTMKQAREILLSMAPPSFSIALSSCYNYAPINDMPHLPPPEAGGDKGGDLIGRRVPTGGRFDSLPYTTSRMLSTMGRA